jgi:hypothetical protein
MRKDAFRNCLAPNPIKCVNVDFRNFYRKETENIKHKRLHHYENDRIIQLFLKKVSEKLLEYRAGIHINRIGYFFVYKHPFRFPPIFRHHLRPYYLTFIPTENSIFKYWSMDFEFNRRLVKQLDDNVKKGYRYLNMINGVSKKEYMYIGAVPNAIRDKKIRDNVI